MTRPFSKACENNKEPILTVLRSAFSPCKQVLEIGSGTGQHAMHFAEHLKHLIWQPSDMAASSTNIQHWLNEYRGSNLKPIIDLDVNSDQWPSEFDAVFSANTAHIMDFDTAKEMLRRVAQQLPECGVFALYGPFNYQGKFTSESNAQFDLWLKERGAHQGIRAFEEVNKVVTENGMTLIRDHDMPANNRLLVWKKFTNGDF